MPDKPEASLAWEGQSTLPALRKLAEARVDFELQLPPDYHFALFRHLFPDAPEDEPEQIDVTGTAELLDKVAEIQGLQELAELADLAGAAQARVRIQSPGPGIRVSFSEPA